MTLAREDPPPRLAGRGLAIGVAGLVVLGLAELAVYWATTFSVRRQFPDLFADIWHTAVTATVYTVCREVPHVWVVWRTGRGIDRLAASFTLWYDGASLLLSVWTFVPKVLAWLRSAPAPPPFAVSQAASLALLALYKVVALVVIAVAASGLSALPPDGKDGRWLAGALPALAWTALLYGLLFAMSVLRGR
jgi:hypothetical protein